MSQKIKSHLLIHDKFLGSLLYFKDKNGKGHLKLSFKNRIANFVKWADMPTTLPAVLKLTELITLDISYKFQDNLLEVKKIVNQKIEREFYKTDMPISACLFVIRIKNWHLLDSASLQKNPLILTPPLQGNSVAIVFSFLGKNNQPITPKEYNCIMGTINIPEDPLKTFCIGITEDLNNNESNDFIIQIPFQKMQIS